jgi:hypothetical protein
MCTKQIKQKNETDGLKHCAHVTMASSDGRFHLTRFANLMLICHRPLFLSMKHLCDIISLLTFWDFLVTPSCEYTQSTARWLGNECDVIERGDEKQSERKYDETRTQHKLVADVRDEKDFYGTKLSHDRQTARKSPDSQSNSRRRE